MSAAVATTAAGGGSGGLGGFLTGPWGLAGGALLGGVMGIIGNNAAKRKAYNQAMADAGSTEYGYWSKMPRTPLPQAPGTGSGIASAFQGALGGFDQMQKLKSSAEDADLKRKIATRFMDGETGAQTAAQATTILNGFQGPGFSPWKRPQSSYSLGDFNLGTPSYRI